MSEYQNKKSEIKLVWTTTEVISNPMYQTLVKSVLKRQSAVSEIRDETFQPKYSYIFKIISTIRLSNLSKYQKQQPK